MRLLVWCYITRCVIARLSNVWSSNGLVSAKSLLQQYAFVIEFKSTQHCLGDCWQRLDHNSIRAHHAPIDILPITGALYRQESLPQAFKQLMGPRSPNLRRTPSGTMNSTNTVSHQHSLRTSMSRAGWMALDQYVEPHRLVDRLHFSPTPLIHRFHRFANPLTHGTFKTFVHLPLDRR